MLTRVSSARMPTVGLLHPGAMGATLAGGLAGAELLWCPGGRGDATRRRAEALRA